VGTAGFGPLVGQHLGYSNWHRVTQEQVNQFADATGDHQWIHVDVERAKTGPFGGPIAHGYLTLSMTPLLLREAIELRDIGMGVNYGLNRLRFPAPVPVGSQLRLGVELVGAEPLNGSVQVTFGLTYEVEGGTKPVCVAEIVFRYFD
jgi:acyl dehydratase